MRHKRHHYILILFVIHLASTLDAQIGLGYGSIGTAVGENSLLLKPANSIATNPAAIHNSSQLWSAAVGGQKLYNTDLSNLSLSAVRNLGTKSIGIQVGSYGIDGFKRSQVTGAYAMQLSRTMTLGLQVNMYQLNIEGLGNQSTFNTTLGFTHFASNSFSYALVAHNMLGAQEQLGISRYFHAEARNTVSEIFSLYNAVYFSPGQTISFRPGILYQAYKPLALNIAFDTGTRSFAFGFNLRLNDQWAIQIANRSHLQLGNSLALSGSYNLTQDHR